MRLLIAVKSCNAAYDAGYHNSILRTWGRDVPAGVDLRFFVGSGDRHEPKPDYTVMLGVPDDYDNLPRKTKAILGWSLWNQYDYTFLCDTDTYIRPVPLLGIAKSAILSNTDYLGRFGAMPALGTTFSYRDARGTYPKCHPWASGGVGYFVSRKAAEVVVRDWPEIWAEDMWVGQVLGPLIQSGEIKALDIPEFECNVAWHFPRRQYNNQVYNLKFGWMEQMHGSNSIP